MKIIIAAAMLSIVAYGQNPNTNIIPLQPGQQINASFENINRNSMYLEGKSTICIAAGVNTLTCPGRPVPTLLFPGLLVSLTAQQNNTGAVTLNIAGLGAKSILSNAAPLASGDLVANNSYMLSYNGTAYNIVSGIPGPPGPPGASFVVDVTMDPYNAVCNGTGDQSAKINAAITAANTAGGGIVISKTGSNCRITSAIQHKSNVTLGVPGGPFTITQATSGLEAIDVGGTTNATISNVIFDGGIIANAGFSNTTGLTIIDNTVKNATIPGFSGTGFYSSVVLINARIVGNTFQNVSHGMLFGPVQHIQVLNNLCNGTTSSNCAYFGNSGTSNTDPNSSIDILFQGNTGINLFRMGFEIQGWYIDAPRVINNSFTNWNPSANPLFAFGISIAHHGVGSIVTGNTLVGLSATIAGTLGIEAEGPSGTLVADNLFENFGDGIQVGNDCDGCTIRNNTISAPNKGIHIINNPAVQRSLIIGNRILEPFSIGIANDDGGGTNAEILNNYIVRTPTPATNFGWYGMTVGTSVPGPRLIQNNTITITPGTFTAGGFFSCFLATATVTGSRWDSNTCVNQNAGTGSYFGILCNSASTELDGTILTNNRFDHLQAANNCPAATSTVRYAYNFSVNGTPADFITATTPNIASGASLPTVCLTGDIFFLTATTAGQNLYGCTSGNTWTLEAGGGGGGSTVIVKLSGSTIGSPRGTLNFIPGSCIALAIADTGTQDNITAAVDTAACPVEKQWTLAATTDGTTAVTSVDLPAASPTVPTLTTTSNGSLQVSQKFTASATTCFQLGDFSLPPVLPASLDFRLKLLSSSATPFTLQVFTSGSAAADPTFNAANTVSFAASTTKTDAVITGLTLTGLVANGPLIMKVCAVTPAADVLAFNAKLQLH